MFYVTHTFLKNPSTIFNLKNKNFFPQKTGNFKKNPSSASGPINKQISKVGSMAAASVIYLTENEKKKKKPKQRLF